MNGTPLQSTLRELRATYTSPIGLSIMGCVGLVAGVTGPFGTFSALSLGARLAYWLAIAYLTYGAGVAGGTFAVAFCTRDTAPAVLRAVIGGFGASVPATGVVVLISAMTFSDLSVTGINLGPLYLYCLIISLALMAVLEIVDARQKRNDVTVTSGTDKIPTAPPRLLERVPREMRAPLSHLSMADHYVEVHTEKGMSLVLMRFSDAISETEGTDGLQIHRSHWVARCAVSGLDRDRKSVV